QKNIASRTHPPRSCLRVVGHFRIDIFSVLRSSSVTMGYRSFSMTALGLLLGVVMVSAQPGPITTSNNTNLIFAASTLLTNGLPGLTGAPLTLMVATVQSNSAQGGWASLVTGQPWVR